MDTPIRTTTQKLCLCFQSSSPTLSLSNFSFNIPSPFLINQVLSRHGLVHMLCARAAKELRLPPREGGYLLVGGDGSPYSVKMRAYLRFRRIPFKWVASMTLQRAGAMNNFFDELFPELKAKVIPVLVRPDGTYANDSTLLILELEVCCLRCSLL